MQKSITKNSQETQNVGQNFAREILAAKPRQKARLASRAAGASAVVLALQGDLGAGKTTFLQGLAKGLGIKEVVNSPTFVIMKKFKLESLGFKFFYHFDLYRLENEKDLQLLNFQEIISNPENIVTIEWPEKISKLLPENIIKINFTHVQENKREIVIQ